MRDTVLGDTPHAAATIPRVTLEDCLELAIDRRYPKKVGALAIPLSSTVRAGSGMPSH
jgi:hypothetical protein